MLLKRFYHEGLAQASYLLGSEREKIALVVDPNRNVEQYERAARESGLRIAYVTETHIHADFVSGSVELADRTGAALLLSAEGGTEWQYAFAARRGARLLREGDALSLGGVRIDVMHTPGHTPEHLTFVVTDTTAADRPMGAFTGDFIFVGDVGRPDLLERAAGVEGSMRASAVDLFRSLRRFAGHPDFLQLWPGHGAGSACGKELGAVPQTTLGYERLFNWAFAIDDEAEFVSRVLDGQPTPPRYFAVMKRVNREGPKVLDARPPLPRRSGADAAAMMADGVLLLDVRRAAEFADAHIPRSVNVPFNRAFVGWAGALLPYDRDIVLVTGDDDHERASAIRDELTMIGVDRVVGYVGTDALHGWIEAGGSLATVAQITPAELDAERASGVEIIDVRNESEWNAGHMPGARHLPLAALPSRLAEIDPDKRIVLHCQGSSRSSIATSYLLAQGITATNLRGGFSEWERLGLPVESDATASAR